RRRSTKMIVTTPKRIGTICRTRRPRSASMKMGVRPPFSGGAPRAALGLDVERRDHLVRAGLPVDGVAYAHQGVDLEQRDHGALLRHDVVGRLDLAGALLEVEVELGVG